MWFDCFSLQSSKAIQPGQLDPQALQRLVKVLSANNGQTSSIAAQVLAEYCQCANKVQFPIQHHVQCVFCTMLAFNQAI